MPKVSVEVGITMKLPGSFGDYFKSTIRIDEVNTEENVSMQLSTASRTVDETFQTIEKILQAKLKEELDARQATIDG